MKRQLPFLDNIQIAVICGGDVNNWRERFTRTADLRNPPLYLSTFDEQTLPTDGKVDVLILDMPAYRAYDNLIPIKITGAKLVILDCKECTYDKDLKAAEIKRIDFDHEGFGANVTALISQIIEAGLLESEDLKAAKRFVAESRVPANAPRISRT